MANNNNIKDQKVKPALSRGLIAATIIAGFLLVVANSALWVNRTLFNADTFTSISSQALLSDSSRNAIAGEVVDAALQNRPLVKNVIGDTVSKLISGLLNTNQAEAAISKVISKIHLAITSENPQNIEFDLSGIKVTAEKIITLIGKDETASNISSIPDTLVILDVSNMPKFYQFATLFLWIAPLALIGAAIILIRPHIKLRRVDMKILTLQGASILGVSLLALLVGPLFRPPLLAQVSSENLRTVTENIYNAFIATFNSQTMWLFWFGFILLLIAGGMFIYTHFIAKRIYNKKQ